MRNIGYLALSLIGLSVLVGGCATTSVPASVAGGECKVFHDPGFAVRGRTLRDNQWIGRTQETGIRVCNWKRPAR